MTQGRWRCLECPLPRWVAGTYQDWMAHYYAHHYDEETNDGT